MAQKVLGLKRFSFCKLRRLRSSTIALYVQTTQGSREICSNVSWWRYILSVQIQWVLSCVILLEIIPLGEVIAVKKLSWCWSSTGIYVSIQQIRTGNSSRQCSQCQSLSNQILAHFLWGSHLKISCKTIARSLFKREQAVSLSLRRMNLNTWGCRAREQWRQGTRLLCQSWPWSVWTATKKPMCHLCVHIDTLVCIKMLNTA